MKEEESSLAFSFWEEFLLDEHPYLEGFLVGGDQMFLRERERVEMRMSTLS